MTESTKPELSSHWSSIREAGTLFGLQFLSFIHRVFGRRAVSVLLLPTVAYFLLFRPASRRSSLEYLNRHFETFPSQWKKPPNLLNAARHFSEFAESVVDKLLSWCVEIDADKFVLADTDQVENLLQDKRGSLIIGSHFGNLEYCRGFMHRYKDKVINILVHDKHSANYNTIMQQLNSESRLNVFQVSDFDIQTMLQIKQKIDAGEWIFIAGDRTPLTGQQRTVPVKFLGATAYFPIGPYLLAQGLACPVRLMFSHRNYHGDDERVFFEVVDFAERVKLDRKQRTEQLQDYAQEFADQLAKQCERSPYQWFNFYPFWAPQSEQRV